MQTYVYYIAEKMPGALEMQRFAHPIHVGLVSARDHEAAYTAVLEDLRPTFASEPQLLEVRFEAVTLQKPAPASGGTASRSTRTSRSPKRTERAETVDTRNSDRRCEAPQGGAMTNHAELRPEVRSAAGRSNLST